jgi:Chitin binding Peritrophin-A domain.
MVLFSFQTPSPTTAPPSTTTPTPSTPGGGITPPNITPGGDPSQLCTEDGYIRDPSDQGVFYQCQKVGDVFIAHRKECPAGLVFDTSINVCSWA